MPQLRLGISGWNYDSWRGTFYPDDLPKRQQPAYASRRFNSIEINGSFYALQRPDTYRTWYEETPHGFRSFRTSAKTWLSSERDVLCWEIGPLGWDPGEWKSCMWTNTPPRFSIWTA